MKNRWPIVLGAIAAVLAVVALMLIALNRSAQEGRRPRIGDPMPEFDLALYSAATGGLGERISTGKMRGTVLVVNFWGSWCPQCHDEAEALQNVYLKLKPRGVEFIGVGYLDTDTKANDYLAQYAITYANGADLQQQIARQYRITAAPETFIVDKNGIVRDIVIGPISEISLTSKIEAALQY
jgi:cytochrome c biogenesis protein CcmG, thiol:disulfide interchange protein DsbE